MAAIVQSNPYNCLIRKIGYSVGLESLLKRVLALSEFYASQKLLSYTAWNDIVLNTYGIDGVKSTEHVANFFSALNLIKLHNKDVTVLYGLDTLSILRRYFADDEAKFTEAAKFILLLAVLENDGDIFINLLSACFDKMKFSYYLKEMLKIKRSAIKKAIRHPEMVKTINSIIDIKLQKQDKQVSSDKSSVFEMRTRSSFEPRTESAFGDANDEIIISDDYLKKVPQTRKRWAQDLGLCIDNTLTPLGHKLLIELTDLKLGSDIGAFMFWPYKQELDKIFIKPEEVGIPSISKWDLLVHLASIKDSVVITPFDESKDNSGTIELITIIHKLYKEGDIHKGKIRHQLPLYVLYPTLVAISYVDGNEILPIPDILDMECKSRDRRINRVNIAGTEGAIIIR